jgi:cytidine deaminase
MSVDMQNLFSSMSQYATQKIELYTSRGVALLPGTTVCVVISGTSQVYCEVSSVANINGKPCASHSERDVFAAMQRNNDPVVQFLALYELSGQSIIPCSGCIQYMLQMNPMNTNCQVVLPDRICSIMEYLQPIMPNAPQPHIPANGPVVTSVPTRSGMSASISVANQEASANSTALREKIGKLKKDFNKPVELEEDTKKKKFFGLF